MAIHTFDTLASLSEWYQSEVFQEISAERLYVHNRRENHWYCYKWASGRREIMFVEEVGGDLPLVMQVYPEL